MPQYVKDPDGNIHQFEDGATPDQIHAQMSTYWSQKQTQPAQSYPGIPGTRESGMQPVEGAPDLAMVPLSPEAERFKRMSLLGGMTGNRALSSAGANLYEHDPSQLARQEASKSIGKAATDLANRQAAGTRIIPGIDALREIVAGTDDQTWANAAGPYNTTPVPPASIVMSSPQAFFAPSMTPTQARASYGAGYFGMNDPNSQENQKAWNLQNSLEHLVGALTEQYIAGVSRGTVANSDARMKVFKDLMDRLRYATSREEAMKILDTAENATRNTFSLPVGEKQRKSEAPAQEKHAEAAPTSQAATALGTRENPIPVSDLSTAKNYRGAYVRRTSDGQLFKVP